MQEAITTARQRRPFTILGMVLALITLGAFLFLAVRPGTASVTLPGTTGSSPVVFARVDIAARSTITASMLGVSKQSSAPPGAFSAVSQVIDPKAERFALIDIKAGQPLLANELVTSRGSLSGAAPGFLDIPQGFVALTIPTSEQQGVAGYIQPGDYIAVIATVERGDVTTSKTIFNNVHVLKVGTSTTTLTPDRNGPTATVVQSANSSSLTVVMNECDAEYLTWFLDRATLRYTLESFGDYDQGGSNNPQKAKACTVDAAGGVTNADVAARFGSGLVP